MHRTYSSARPFSVLLTLALAAVACSETTPPEQGSGEEASNGGSASAKGGASSKGSDSASTKATDGKGGNGSSSARASGGSKANASSEDATGGTKAEASGGGKATSTDGSGGSKTNTPASTKTDGRAGSKATGTGGAKAGTAAGGTKATAAGGAKSEGSSGSKAIAGAGGKSTDAATGGKSAAEVGGAPSTTTPTASKEDDFGECKVAALPDMNSLKSIPKLPDPFTFKFGDGGTISKKDQWKCRRAEINAAAQKYIYGEKPVPEETTATYSGGKLNITVKDNGKSVSFSVSISGGDPSKPKPLLLEFGGGGSFGGNLIGVPADVVKAGFPDSTIAVDGKSRSGKFYDLYGASHPAGELIAWAWGVSRIIDALEKAPEAGIDPTKVAIHGCSRYGKGALAVGAFDNRVALTIPEEGGSGGAACWRMIKTDSAAQPLSSACTECVWFEKNFCSFDGKQDKLPVDMHEVMAMVAPRGLLYLDQPSADWLGKSTGYWSANATAEVFKALGEQGAFTYTQMNGSGHCSTPQGQTQFITAYVNYYLLGKGSKPAGAVNKSAAAAFSASQWIDWTTPTLQ
ncbi:MAG TPA: hypothetical protein VKP30_16860 [Polyangiaceae bacterium]|nr:hypothetical protein [Polyangiaceae bacterium]